MSEQLKQELFEILDAHFAEPRERYNELMADRKEIDAIFCCVGGGGLLAGISAYCKRVTPKTRMKSLSIKYISLA